MKLFLCTCTFLIVLSLSTNADAIRQNSLDSLNRHIGMFFARKIVLEKMAGGAMCNECKEVAAELHTVVADPGSEQEVAQLLDQYVCPSLTTHKELCDAFVSEVLPAVFAELEAVLENPQAFCQEIDLCSNSKTKNVFFQPKKLVKAMPIRRRHQPKNWELSESDEMLEF